MQRAPDPLSASTSPARPTAPPVAGAETKEYEGAGGRRLRYRFMRAAPESHRVLVLHGIESHGGWFHAAARALAERGCTTFLLDRRGSGLNRGDEPGDAESAEVLLEDVARFRDHAGDPPLLLVGQSWGGKLATAAAIERPANVRGLVLVAPGIRANVRLPARDLARVAASALAGGRARVRVPIDDEMFARDPAVLDFIARDPLRVHKATARLLLAGRSLDRRVVRGIASLRMQVFLALADDDPIVDEPALLALLRRLPKGALRVRRFPGRHSIQLEHPDALAAQIASFAARTEDRR
jgi:pimeloyl-ACP methyl ester carboxylesterase